MKKIIGSGSSGKGGGTGRIAQEDSDSLQSINYVQILDLVSEGEIQGLVNGLHSVFLDDTPIIDSNGNYNFSGVSFDSRNGTQFQDPILGISSSENEVVVGVEVKSSQPVVKSITNSSINAINVRIGIPQLTYQDPSNGDLKGSEVTYAIELNNNASGWVQVANDTIIGKCVSKYTKSYRVDLKSGTNQVRVRKITSDSAQSNLINKIYWDSYGEVIEGKLNYPNSALMAIRVDAANFKSIPKRSYELKLLKIKVPTNYDPIKKIYSGFWDGTFKVSWSDNPAWVLYDLLTNARYGCGLDEKSIDKFSLYKIAKYCDEFVDDGFGSKEPRFTINCYMQTRAEAFNVIRDITNVFRGLSYWQGGTLSSSQDCPQDPIFIFNPSNVVKGEFQYQGTSLKTRYTVALITWNDPDDMYRPKVEYVEDADAIAKYGIQQVEITSFGCTSQGQARRVGKWAIYSSQNETETVSFQTGIEVSGIRIGSIIKVQDPLRAGISMSGRVSSASNNSVTVDRDMNINLLSDTFSITVMLPDGSVEKKNIVSVSGRQFFVDSIFSIIPHNQSVFIIQSTKLQAQTFRVTSIGEDKGLFSISALAHNDEKYNYIEKNLKISDRKITLLSVTPATPFDLKVTETLYLSNGEVKTKITFSWATCINASYYIPYYKKNNNNAVFVGEIKSNEVEILNLDPGSYEFGVSSFSSFGIESELSTITYQVLGKIYPPSDIQGFSLIPLNGLAYLSWNLSSDLDVINGGSVRLRFSENPSGTWQNSVDVAILSGNSTRAQVPLMNGTYFAKFIDSSGSASINASSIKTNALEATSLNVVYNINEYPSFSGQKTNMFFSDFYNGLSLSSSINIDDWTGNVDDIPLWDYLGGVSSSGEYLFSNVVDLGAVFTSNIKASIDATSVDVADSIDMRAQNIDDWLDIDGVYIDDVNAELFVSTTEDDPNSASPVWTEWKRFLVGQYKARGLKFKLIATSASQNHNIIIRNLAISIDVPDRTISLNQIVSSTSPTNVVYEKPFFNLPAVSITAYAMGKDDRYTITDATSSGFKIIFYDGNNNPISRTFDVIARGFGRRVG